MATQRESTNQSVNKFINLQLRHSKHSDFVWDLCFLWSTMMVHNTYEQYKRH